MATVGPRTALTIGNFDGVHIGHRALLSRARAIAGAGGRVAALVFFPHPLSALDPSRAPALLTTLEERTALLRGAGADEVVHLPPTPETLEQSPEAFVRAVCGRYAPAAIVEGADFRFGKGRSGDMALLAELGRELGFEAVAVPEQAFTLHDLSAAPASSTLVRWLLDHGRVRDASAALGRPYAMVGTVVRGDQRGRLLNMRTANLDSPVLAPGDGVYAGVAQLPDGSRWPAAVSVGTNPTFNGRTRRAEAHVIGWTGPPDPADEYGWPIRVEFHAWLRGQIRFDGVEPLVRQMQDDLRRALEVLSLPPAPAAVHA
ncbi:MAG: bifunctional riboflavin kinase/FMN adenylyltransferase [Phycisphaerales bacterium]|nr:bifunctional riboflavin kinase/FMN adenylyltransferase [Phycisphaerales bacterium]